MLFSHAVCEPFGITCLGEALMICLVLSPEEKAQVEQARRTRPQIAERCHYVLLNAEGWRVPQIAQRLDRNEHTIRTWAQSLPNGWTPRASEHPATRAASHQRPGGHR